MAKQRSNAVSRGVVSDMKKRSKEIQKSNKASEKLRTLGFTNAQKIADRQRLMLNNTNIGVFRNNQPRFTQAFYGLISIWTNNIEYLIQPKLDALEPNNPFTLIWESITENPDILVNDCLNQVAFRISQLDLENNAFKQMVESNKIYYALNFIMLNGVNEFILTTNTTNLKIHINRVRLEAYEKDQANLVDKHNVSNENNRKYNISNYQQNYGGSN